MVLAVLQQVAINCADPRGLAAFYQQICGGVIDDSRSDGSWVQLTVADGTDIGFQLDPDHEPDRTWPVTGERLMHLDFFTEDLDAGEEWVLALGARKAAAQPTPDRWRVFLDPAGYVFCLVND